MLDGASLDDAAEPAPHPLLFAPVTLPSPPAADAPVTCEPATDAAVADAPGSGTPAAGTAPAGTPATDATVPGLADPTSTGDGAGEAWGQRATEDLGRRELANRITEEVLQLLYTAHQDLAEIGERGADADPELVQSAQECTLGAISILRVIAASVVAPVPADGADPAGSPWARSASLLFDAMTDAWLVTCTDRDLLYASDAACALLGRTRDEVAALFREKTEWPAEIGRAVHRTAENGDVLFDIDVPLTDGTLRPIRVVAHLLPAVPGVKRSYISLLSER